MFPCCSFGWLFVVPDVILPLTWVAIVILLLLTNVTFCHPRCCIGVHEVALCHHRFSTADYWCGSVLFQMFYCHSLGSSALFPVSNCHLLLWLPFVPVFSLLLTGLALWHPICFTVILWCGSMSLQMSQCHSVGWFCIIPGFSLALTGVVQHCHSCPWHCIISGVSLPLTEVTLCCFRCPTDPH